MADLKITLIQTNLFWEDKNKNIDLFDKKIASVEEPTDIILLPEMFTTGFSMNAGVLAEKMDGPSVTWMSKLAKRKKCVIAGSLIISDGGRYYNRLIWMKPDGFEFYDKRHLFSLSGEEKTYDAGKSKKIFTLKDWNILPLVCYDLRFPVWCRRTRAENYDLLLFAANWPERRIFAWKQLLIARAIENQCYVAGLNRIGNDGNNIHHNGQSAVLDYKGETAGESFESADTIKTITLQKEPLLQFRKQFAFFEDADDFKIH